MKKGQGFARRVTLANLKDFEPLLGKRSTSEESSSAEGAGGSEGSEEADSKLEAAESLFSGSSIKIQGSYHPATPTTRKAKKAPKKFPPGRVKRGELVWEKSRLPQTDAQRPSNPATNPTGCVRLTQAGFKVGGKRIDPTSYFRDEVFGSYRWRQIKSQPEEYETRVPARILLLDKDYGVHNLEIRHKPSGEAGQSNYTTSLHWGDLGETVRSTVNLVGKTLRLFAPLRLGDPFTLEVL